MASTSGDFTSQPAIDEIEILRATIYHSTEGIIVSDKEGKFIICNRVARSLLKISAKEGLPHAWPEVDGCVKPDGVTPYPPEELPHARALAGETVPETEILIRNKQDPSGIWISVQANPLRNHAGEIRGSVVAFHDITKKKEADTLIQTLTNAVEQTADGIMITDRSGVIEYVNPGFEATTGYKLEELRGLTPRILKSGVHEDSFYENLWATILAGNVFRNTIANKKKNGDIFYAEQTITPMRGPTGSITQLVTVIKDVTELRKMQEQEAQMNLARAVQQQLYKMPPPKIDGFDYAGSAFPADATGGDYFDFVQLPGDCVGIIIGDVSGHGIGSALLMVELRAFIRAFAQKSDDVGEILTLVNNALVSDLELDRYATLIFCRLHPATRTIVYASAGHSPGFIFDSSGAVKHTLDSTDIPLGFMKNHDFSCKDPIRMEKGDFLALLTDGITDTERPDETFFGIERALDYIGKHCLESAQDIVNGLYKTVRDFADGMPQIDDITAVVCKTTGNQINS